APFTVTCTGAWVAVDVEAVDMTREADGDAETDAAEVELPPSRLLSHAGGLGQLMDFTASMTRFTMSRTFSNAERIVSMCALSLSIAVLMSELMRSQAILAVERLDSQTLLAAVLMSSHS